MPVLNRLLRVLAVVAVVAAHPSPAGAQTSADLAALSEDFVRLYRAGKYAESIEVAQRALPGLPDDDTQARYIEVRVQDAAGPVNVGRRKRLLDQPELPQLCGLCAVRRVSRWFLTADRIEP